MGCFLLAEAWCLDSSSAHEEAWALSCLAFVFCHRSLSARSATFLLAPVPFSGGHKISSPNFARAPAGSLTLCYSGVIPNSPPRARLQNNVKQQIKSNYSCAKSCFLSFPNFFGFFSKGSVANCLQLGRSLLSKLKRKTSRT